MRVLIVEDDPMIARSLDRALTEAGMAVDRVATAADAAAALAIQEYSVVLLDLGLPDASGVELLRRLRANGNDTPSLVITARDDVAMRVAALDLGSDDYLVKPFHLDELLARIRAVLRRSQGRATGTVVAGEIQLDPATHEVSYRGTTAVLPAREFALLHALAERPGTILSRHQLETAIYDWGNEVESNAVDVLIHYVRKRFDKDVIRNLRGIGWTIPKAPR
ncbi:MAG: response regulator transcription factor [Bauldia sp.]|nr:response regulator transcription factor [Bauldia sp.]